MERNIEDQLTLFAEGFPVSRTHSQDQDSHQPIAEICGQSIIELLAKVSQDGLLLKMSSGFCQVKTDGTLEEYSETWPQSGTMQNGLIYRLDPLVRRIYAPECGWLPTPTKHNEKEGAYPSEYNRNTPTLATHAGGKINPEWSEHLMGFPISHTDLQD